jgi:hypothetical protein
LSTETKQRVDACITESEDIANIFSDWKYNVIESDRKSPIKMMKNESDERQETNEPKDFRLLNLLQKMDAIPPSSMSLSSYQSKGSVLNKDAEGQIAETVCCWACISNLFPFKPISGENKETNQEESESANSILLGHSDDVVVEVEVNDGKVPPFEIKISPVSKAEYGGRYRGLYSWPKNAETAPDHFYGEFSDGNRIDDLVD